MPDDRPSKKSRRPSPGASPGSRSPRPGQGKRGPRTDRERGEYYDRGDRNDDRSSSSRPARETRENVKFPSAWLWLVDEAVPAFVKKTYSPRESWKDKPFSKEDGFFFFKGIAELSDLFTEERPQKMPDYFAHPKYRSAYLLYFLPLQMSKFTTIFQLHPRALALALEHGRKKGTLRIADLGAGPGTASIAALLSILDLANADGKELPKVELDWIDTNRGIMEDGRMLAEQLASSFPKLRGKLTVRIHAAPWRKALNSVPEDCSLILMGHVLNEARMEAAAAQERAIPKHSRHRDEEFEGDDIGTEDDDNTEDRLPAASDPAWVALLARSNGGGILVVEPAMRSSSQKLSRLRNSLFESETLRAKPSSLWGPCLHAEKCPLSGGRDWCHFSVPAWIPGEFFKKFSKMLSSEKEWVKFSYLWIASPKVPAPTPDASLRRVISDPIRDSRGVTLLLCEPERPGRLPAPPGMNLRRGSLWKMTRS